MSNRNKKKPTSDVGFDIMMMVTVTILVITCILTKADIQKMTMAIVSFVLYALYIIYAYIILKRK